MATETRIPTSRSTIDAESLATLQAGIGGQVLTAGQHVYEESRHIWNGMIDAHPAVIIRPFGVADVVQAIAFAREHDLEISIKGGGHNVAGYATTDGGLMIDLEHLRQVEVDPGQRIARAGGGARWSDFDRETAVFGLATTGGVISTTGVAGLTLGGGVGWLARSYGLASDNLRSATVVIADGEVITASEESHPDLFWALRGGGGNFGVVTSLEFGLHPVSMVFAGMVAFPFGMARDVLQAYRDVTSSAPDELSMYCSIATEPEHGMRVMVVPFCWSGDVDMGQQMIQPIMEVGTPVMTMAGPMPYAAFNSATDYLFPHGRRNYWKGVMVTDLEDGVIDQLESLGSDPPLPGQSVTIELYGGETSRIAAHATAYPHRDARYQIVINSQWDDPADDVQGRHWTRGVHRAIEPYAKRGQFLNFVNLDGDERQKRIRAGYGDHWDRLVEIKRRYDPQNVFHRNNTITP